MLCPPTSYNYLHVCRRKDGGGVTSTLNLALFTWQFWGRKQNYEDGVKWLLLRTKGWTHSTHLRQSFGLLKVPPKGLVIITPQFVHTCTPIPTHTYTLGYTHHCLMKPRSYGCGQLKTGMDFFRPLGDGDPNTTVFPPKTTRSSPSLLGYLFGLFF